MSRKNQKFLEQAYRFQVVFYYGMYKEQWQNVCMGHKCPCLGKQEVDITTYLNGTLPYGNIKLSQNCIIRWKIWINFDHKEDNLVSKVQNLHFNFFKKIFIQKIKNIFRRPTSCIWTIIIHYINTVKQSWNYIWIGKFLLTCRLTKISTLVKPRFFYCI